jgi:phage recombination protein Bet
MTTDLAHAPRREALYEWSDSFRQLVKSTVLKPKSRDATDAELALLAEQAVRTGLDPMARQIYGIYRKDNRSGDEVMTIQVGIDGLRSVAERTGRYGGSPAYLFCGPDKQWTDVWLEEQRPVAAKAIVLKVVAGAVINTEAVALWSEYGNDKNVWKDKPALMLGKCAEALALRKAFPQDLSGLYTDDEMDRVDPAASQPKLQAIPSAQSVPPDVPVPDEWPARQPEVEAVVEGEAVEMPVDPMDGAIDPAFVNDLADEFKRRSYTLGQFRDALLRAGIVFPDDLRSEEKRIRFLSTLTVGQGIELTKAMNADAQAAA